MCFNRNSGCRYSIGNVGEFRRLSIVNASSGSRHQPNSPHGDGGGGGAGQKYPIWVEPGSLQFFQGNLDQCPENGHGGNGAQTEKQQVGQGSCESGNGQGWQHTEDIGAPREGVQNSHSNGKMGMQMGLAVLVILVFLFDVVVKVNVGVPDSIMGMFVRMKPLAHGPVQAPGADGDEGYAHQAFAPGGNQLQGEQIPQKQRQDANQQYPRGMSKAP